MFGVGVGLRNVLPVVWVDNRVMVGLRIMKEQMFHYEVNNFIKRR